jgi:O-antigen/teichoic acid export membrane protein
MIAPDRTMTLAHLRRHLGGDPFIHSLLSSGFAALVIKIATAGLSYLMFVFFARFMSSGEFGRFAFGFSLATTLAAVAAAGLSTAVLRFWPEYRVGGRADLASSFIRCGWWGTLAASLVTALGLLVISLIFGQRTGAEAAYYGAVGLLMGAIALSEFGACALRADGRTVLALAPRDVFWRIALLLSLSILGMAKVRLDAVAGLFLSGAVLAMIVAVQSFWLLGMTRGGVARTVPTEIRLKWITTLWPFWGAGVLYAMVQQFDVVVVGLFLMPEQSGSYFAALRTASLLGLTLIAGNMVGAPLIARYYHSGSHAELVRLCRVLSLCIALPTLSGLIFLLVTGRWLLAIFDASFADAYDLLVILAAGFAFAAFCGPTTVVLQMIGRERDHLKMMVLCYAATLGAQCLLTPQIGPLGVALPAMIGMIGQSVWALHFLRSKLALDCSIFGLLWKPPSVRTANCRARPAHLSKDATSELVGAAGFEPATPTPPE